MNGAQGEEARRSTRVATSFLVAIDGIDAELTPRRGDISATGVYFETTARVGDAGSVQFLCIASASKSHEIRLMAHVVRTIALDDVDGGQLFGVAFEFMPESEEAAVAVANFVQTILFEEPNEPGLSPRLPARAASNAHADDTAILRQLSVRSMTLETNWGVTPGERLRVEIAAPGRARRVRLEGSAVRVTPRGDAKGRPPYEVEVEFQTEIERPPRRASSMSFAAVRPELMTSYAVKPTTKPENVQAPAEGEDEVSRVLDDLFAALIHPPAEARPKREHLSGLLTRIRLPTLCALFDMERLSGELTLKRDDAKAVIYIRDGQLIDVEVEGADASSSPRGQIGELLAWDDGSFEFAVRPVDRPDRVGTTTTALLLDLAREDDEKRAGGVF